ncbi:amino acid ABC transporter permease [Paucidesulfovibrio longus]|uniref:amino acid ABC transporter permease n=1 Tax=Paucidesulfovibrio longus TaxID=889 RepID=UPI0003B47544|nr:amino acid ABC transporter permease [Paucidesulfovibrio longus]
MRNRKLRVTPLDAAVLLLLTGAALAFGYRVAGDLNYRWDWSSMPHYLLRWDAKEQTWRAGLLLQGLFVTLRLSVLSGLLATLFGMVMGLFRTSRSPLRQMIGGAYVGLVRNTPPLVLVFVFYYFLGDQIMAALGVNDLVYTLPKHVQSALEFALGPVEQIPAFLSAVLTLALFEGAYITEIVRAGVESVEKGQWEASAALGFSRWGRLRHVILPQALVRMIPALAGQFISTIKDSAIVSIISIQELTFAGQELMAATYRTFEIWTLVLALYFAMTFPLSLGVRALEGRMNKFRNGL